MREDIYASCLISLPSLSHGKSFPRINILYSESSCQERTPEFFEELLVLVTNCCFGNINKKTQFNSEIACQIIRIEEMLHMH